MGAEQAGENQYVKTNLSETQRCDASPRSLPWTEEALPAEGIPYSSQPLAAAVVEARMAIDRSGSEGSSRASQAPGPAEES